MSEGRASLQCPECDTVNRAGTKFCESCGLLLKTANATAPTASPTAPDPSDAAPRRKSTRRRAADPDRVERIEIQRQLGKARRLLNSIRWIYIVLAVASVLTALARTFAQDHWGITTSQKVIAWVPAIVLISGCIFLFSQPLFFTLALACLYTVSAVLDGMRDPYSVSFLVNAFIALACWCAVGPIAGVMKLMREHPGLVDATELKKRRGMDAPTGAALARAEERRAERRGASLRMFAIVAGSILLLIGGIFGYSYISERNAEAAAEELAKTKDARFEERIGQFVAAWRRDDTDWIAAAYTEHRRKSSWPDTLRGLEKRGWAEDLPNFDPKPETWEQTHVERSAYFDFERKGKLKTYWVWVADDWRIHRLTLSRTR